MTITGFPDLSLQANRLREFLREEMVPTPERWQQTLRITLACVAASWAVMAFHLKVPLLVMIIMFLVTQRDTTTTTVITMVGILGTAIGCGGLLLAYMAIVDLTWLRVLLVPAFIALGLFINRIFTLGPVGSAIGIPLAVGIFVPDIMPSSEFLSRFPSSLWWAIVFGLLVSLAVQCLMNPINVRSLLAGGLSSRLLAVEHGLLRLAGDEPEHPQPASLASLAVEGAARQLGLLNLTSLLVPWLKQHKAQVTAQIILVDRLVTAAAALEQQGVQNPGAATRRRLRHIAQAASAWRQAVLKYRWPDLPEAAETGQAEPGALPALAEMGRVLELVATARAKSHLPEELTTIPRTAQKGLIVSDAFRNPAYVHHAVKGAIAGFICYLIFTLSAYQGIYTSVITCIVCSLSTVGASVQKGVLRFCGSAVGGALGVITLMYVFPQMDSIVGFWVPFGAVTALAAYVTQGSPAISYAGYQVGLAFYKCTLQAYGPYTELRVVRDRLIGIALGLIVFELINTKLWPVKALDTARAKLASLLHTLATLAGLPDKTGDPKARLSEGYDLRLQAYEDLGTVHQVLVGARFEPDEALRRKLETISNSAEALLVQLLAIIQHRPDLRPEAVPEPSRSAGARFRSTLAAFLRNLGDRTSGQKAVPLPDLQDSLAELEQTVTLHINAVTDAEVAAHIRARLELYRQTVPMALQLAI
jgi:multidrug resistance protein MdtO